MYRMKLSQIGPFAPMKKSFARLIIPRNFMLSYNLELLRARDPALRGRFQDFR